MPKIETAEDVYKYPHHSFRRELKDAYKVDLTLLPFVQKQVERFADKPLDFAIDLDGGYHTSGSELDTVTASPLIETRSITGMSVTSRHGSPFRFTFAVRNSSLGSVVEVSGYDDPLEYEGLIKQIEDRMKSLRPWYWAMYRFPVELALVGAILIFTMFYTAHAMPNAEPNLRVIMVGIPLIAIAITGRHFLFRRVEFMNGLIKRYADRRAGWQKFVGVTVIAGTLLTIARDWLFPGGTP